MEDPTTLRTRILEAYHSHRTGGVGLARVLRERHHGTVYELRLLDNASVSPQSALALAKELGAKVTRVPAEGQGHVTTICVPVREPAAFSECILLLVTLVLCLSLYASSCIYCRPNSVRDFICVPWDKAAWRIRQIFP